MKKSPGPLFVISTGRTGSTLLQRLLNCHPDLVVWGEHHGFLSGLINPWLGMSRKQGNQFPLEALSNPGPEQLLPTLDDPAIGIEWANPYSAQEFASQARDFITHYFSSRLEPHQTWGFKEIRYNNLATLNGLRDLFPEGRFVFNTRDPREVVRSKLYAFVKEKNFSAMEQDALAYTIKELSRNVEEHYALYEAFTDSNPSTSLLIRYEDLISDAVPEVRRVINLLALDQGKLDQDMLSAVMENIVSKTKRNDEISQLIEQLVC